MASQPVALAYASDESTSPRIVRRGVLVLLILIAGLNLLVRGFGDRAWDAGMSAYWQEQCLTYELPADRVAYVAAPHGQLNLPSYLADFSDANSTWAGVIAAAPYPIELAELHKQLAPHSATPWERLPAPVFLHGCTDSRGRVRLVTVYALANNPQGWWTLVADTRELPSITSTTALSSISAAPIVSTACWPMQTGPGASMIVFEGQRDSSDPSRFTLRVRLNGQEQLVTGVLKDDGKIEFTSTTGLVPWNTDRAGPIIVPKPRPVPAPNSSPFQGSYDPNDNVLLPVD